MVAKRTRSSQQDEIRVSKRRSVSSRSKQTKNQEEVPDSTEEILPSRLLMREYFQKIGALNEEYLKFVEENSDNTEVHKHSAHEYLHYSNQICQRYNRKSGITLTCGNGDCGQLGHGLDEADKMVYRPRVVEELMDYDVTMVAAGGLHNVVCTADGQVLTWGCNDDGSLGRITDGEVDEMTPKKVDMGGKIVSQVAAGDCQTLALTVDGEVYGWGCYKDNEGKPWFCPKLENEEVISKLHGSPLKRIAAHCRRVQRVPQRIVGLKNIVDIRCAASSNIALDNTGRVFTWGIGESNELGRPVCSLKFQKPNSEMEYNFDKVCKDHLIPGELMITKGETAFEKFGPFKGIGAGSYHMMVIDKYLKLHTFGLNNYGQLGDGDTKNRWVLTRVKNLSKYDITSVAGGAFHTVALTTTGKMLAFGRSDYGQIGTKLKDTAAGSFLSKPVPVKMPLDSGRVVQIAAGPNHSMCITNKSNGFVWGFGENGQLGLGKSENDQYLPKKIDFSKYAATKGVRVAQMSGGGVHTAMIVY